MIRLSWYVLLSSLYLRLPHKYMKRNFLQSAVIDSEGYSCSVGDLLLLDQRIKRVSAYIPWKYMCYEQALTARLYLRYLGYPHELYLGFKNDAAGEKLFHAWVIAEGLVVTGYPNIPSYTPLQNYKDNVRGNTEKS